MIATTTVPFVGGTNFPPTSHQLPIHAIANRQRIDLPSELSSRFGVSRPDDLDIREASELIDSIKPQNNGNGNGNGGPR